MQAECVNLWRGEAKWFYLRSKIRLLVGSKLFSAGVTRKSINQTLRFPHSSLSHWWVTFPKLPSAESLQKALVDFHIRGGRSSHAYVGPQAMQVSSLLLVCLFLRAAATLVFTQHLPWAAKTWPGAQLLEAKASPSQIRGGKFGS